MVMKRYLLAAVASVMLVGFVAADEFRLQITSIDADGSVTGTRSTIVKGGKGVVKSEELTVKLARDVRVHMVDMNKRDPRAKKLVAEGEDLKVAGLKGALLQAQKDRVLVDGKAIGEKDKLELSMPDDKPAAKLNGKDIPFATVEFRRKGPLYTSVTTSDDGAATTILILISPRFPSSFDLWEKKAAK
jgi:hypothetical protein